jgi:hypothetical protein
VPQHPGGSPDDNTVTAPVAIESVALETRLSPIVVYRLFSLTRHGVYSKRLPEHAYARKLAHGKILRDGRV